MFKVRKNLLKLVILALLLSFFPCDPVHGGLIPHESDSDKTLSSGTQSGVLFYEDGTQDLYLQRSHEGDSDNFVWVVPVPETPEVETVNSSVFKISEFMDVEGLEGSFYTDPKERDDDLYKAHDTLVLPSSGENEVYKWLKNKGYNISEDTKSDLEYYMDKDWFFVVTRVNPRYVVDEVIKEFDQDTREDITVINLNKELARYYVDSVKNKTPQNFKKASMYLDRLGVIDLDDSSFGSAENLKNMAPEKVVKKIEEQYGGFSRKISDYLLKEFRKKIQSQLNTLAPQKTVDALVHEFDQDTQENVSRDNLAPKLSEHYADSILEDDLENFLLFSDYLTLLLPENSDNMEWSTLDREEAEEKFSELVEDLRSKSFMEDPEKREEYSSRLSSSVNSEIQQSELVTNISSPDKNFISPIKISFETDTPVYPLRTPGISGGSEDGAGDLSLSTVFDEPKKISSWDPVAEKTGVYPGLPFNLERDWSHSTEYVFNLYKERVPQKEIGRNIYFEDGGSKEDKESREPGQDLKDKNKGLVGKILLQVEQNGEAWYVNPEDNQRHFMGRPKDAFGLMRDLGTGISTDQLQNIPIGGIDNLSGEDSDGDGLPDMFEDAVGTDKNNPDSDDDGYSDKEEVKNGYNPKGPGRSSRNIDFAQAQAGKILLQVEGSGEAWYVSPEDNQRYFLGRPADAFAVMRSLGTGITDSKLDDIPRKSHKDKQVEKNKIKAVGFDFWETLSNLEFSKLDDFYADEVWLLRGSEFLKDEWGLNEGGDRSRDLLVDRSELIELYEKMAREVGKEKWVEAFSEIDKSAITFTSPRESVMQDSFQDINFKEGDIVMEVETGPGDDVLLFVLRPVDGGIDIVMEFSDY